MKLIYRKWLLISVFIIILPILYSLFTYIITGKGDSLFIRLTNILRKENIEVTKNLNLPEFQLILSENDIDHFADLYKHYDPFQVESYQNIKVFYPYYQKNNKWKNAILFFNNQKFDIKIKSHGSTPAFHNEGKFISYNIKILNNHKIYNSSQFRLIVYWRTRYFYDFLYDLLTGTDMIFQRNKLVLLKINDWDSKLYFFELKVDQKYLYNYKIKNKIILKKNEYKSLIYDGGDTADFMNTLNEFIQINKKKINTLKFYHNFNYAIINRLSNEIINFLDIEYITTFNALRLLTRGDAHGLFVENLLCCFDSLNQKFYPIFHRDFTWDIVSNYDNFHLVSNRFSEGANSDLFFTIDANDSLRMLTYKKMYEYIIGKRECKLKNNMDSIINFHESLYYSSKIKSLIGLGKEEFISNSYNFFNNFFEDVNLNINCYKDKDTLMMEIEPNSKSFLGIEKLNIHNIDHGVMDSITLKLIWIVEDKIMNEASFSPDEQSNSSVSFTKSLKNIHFFDKLDNKSQWKKSKYQLIFKLNSSNANYTIDYLFENKTTGKLIPKENIKVRLKK